MFIICEAGVEERLVHMLRDAGVPGYTRFSNATGSGKRGRREGSPVWPGLNTLFMVGAPEEMVPAILESIDKLEKERDGRLSVKVFSATAQEYC
jgi:hypothetical protein